MGQYYKAIVLKKSYKNRVNPIEATLDSWEYANGAKLMEHSYIGNSYVRAAEELLHYCYNGYPFVWCGDYSDDVDFKKFKGNLYDLAYAHKKNLAIHVTNEVEYSRYLVNYTKRQYVELKEFVPNKFQIHPLPLLCSDGNGRGGGDYHGNNMEYVGLWAYNRIGICDKIPDGFKKLDIEFIEEY